MIAVNWASDVEINLYGGFAFCDVIMIKITVEVLNSHFDIMCAIL